MAIEYYPGKNFFKSADNEEYTVVGLVEIYSITYNSRIDFLPYDLKITENLTPEWNQETVIGRMDPIARFKRMGRTMNINFKARAREDLYSSISDTPYLPYDDLLHSVDHLKAVMYPKYSVSGSVMTSPPLFRIKCENLILAGENTISDGVLGYITTLKADPIMDKNSVLYIGTQGNATYDQGLKDKITREPKKNERKFGNLETAMYPKGFDINIGFVVLNENLSGVHTGAGSRALNPVYFYNFVTDRGPAGGHPTGHTIIDKAENISNNTIDSDSEQKANEERVLGK